MSKSAINIEGVTLNIEAKTLHLQFKTYDSSNNKPPLKIVIDNQKTFICKNDYSTSAYVYDITTQYSPTQSGGMWEYTTNLTISLPETNCIFIPEVEDNLYFVYIYSTGDTTDEPYLEAVIPVYDEQTIYNKTFNIIKQEFSGCNTFCKENNTNSSINTILGLKGLEYALVTGDYKSAINFWNIVNSTFSTVTNHCNCN